MSAANEIDRRLRRIMSSGRSVTEIFDDWLEIVEATLRMLPAHVVSALEHQKPAEDDDETKALLARMRKHYAPEHFNTFAETFGLLLDSTIEDGKHTYRDVVGDVYMLMSESRSGSGQFFTPWDVAKMMAEMQSDHGKAVYLADEQIRVNDPACGSGVLLLAMASTFPRWMLNRGLVQFYGQDIDETCVRMARINMRLYGLNGTALWLPVKTHEHVERTPVPPLDLEAQ